MSNEPELIRRALVTRIEYLETSLARLQVVIDETNEELQSIWGILFPDRPGEPFDAGIVLQELRRRGLQERT